MKKTGFLLIGLTALMIPTLSVASSHQDMGDLYKNRCANCHGITANGVPKLKEQHGVNPEEANTNGIASQKKLDIYGPPLNLYSKDELIKKLMDVRGKNFDGDSYHATMGDNLQKVEKRDGKIDDEEMAEYISKTFGGKK